MDADDDERGVPAKWIEQSWARRRAWASELHGQIAQLLVAARMRSCHVSRGENEGDREEVRRNLDDLLREATERISRLTDELFPSVALHIGLEESLVALHPSELQDRVTVEIKSSLDRVPDMLALSSYELVREVARRAHDGDAIRVSLSSSGDAPIELTFDGCTSDGLPMDLVAGVLSLGGRVISH